MALLTTTVGTAEEASKRIGLYNRFMSRAEELALPDTVDAKPILDVSLFEHIRCIDC